MKENPFITYARVGYFARCEPIQNMTVESLNEGENNITIRKV